MWKLFLLIILIIFEVRANTFRLPNDTRPEAYHVVLEFVEIGSSTVFNGETFIKFHVLEDTNQITIHSAVDLIELPFLCIEMNSNCATAINLTYTYISDYEFLIITSPNLLIKGEIFYLNLRYTANIFTSIHGVYRGNYLSQQGDRK